MTKVEQLQSLALDIKSCKKCPLCYTRDQPSISRGDPRSPLMIIGDIPRSADHKSGEAFSGRAGKKMDSLLSEAGIEPENVYFTNLIKCFPGQKGRFPEDNSPALCYGWLSAQIKIVNPLLVILSGPETLEWVLLRGSTENADSLISWLGITLRRRDVYGELRFMTIPHPSLLANHKNVSLEESCVKALTTAKEFIVSRQTGQLVPHIDVLDIKKKIVVDRKAQLEGIKWQNPALLKPPDTPEDKPITTTS